ncbi:MAG: restriction endonuclease subunit S [Thermoguttaceae bacterium]|nr:restriction endonuclease subunit S [Thermoguttaceae bacterium]
MKTRSVELGDIADTCLGKMLDQRKNKGEYQPYLANVNVRWGDFDLENLPQMRFLESEEKRYGLEYGDILVCEGGEPGRCAIWKEQIPKMKFQKALHRVRVHKDEADYRWLFYRLLYAKYRREFDQYFSGTTTIKHMPGDKLVKIRIDLPELAYQKAVANILSAYDNLIENNRKQIKLLEEAAQRLYKEWFIDLRFPGYEETPIVDGIPQGWEKGELGDIANFKRGKTITKAQVCRGDIPVVAGGLEPAYYHNKANTVSPVITVSGSGANAGFTRLYNVDVFASDCSYVDNESTSYLFFVYCYLRANKSSLDSLQKGAAQPHVYAKDLNAMKLHIPLEKHLRAFCNVVSPLFEKIKVLQRGIGLSTQARDRLLPKLMNNEIKV